MKKLIFFIIAIFALNLPILAQEKTPDFTTVKTDKGMMVVVNNKTQPFSFLVAGQNPNGRQNNDGSLQILTDNGGLNIYFIKTKDFLDAKKQYDVAETLTAQRDSDIDAQEKAWKSKLDVDVKGFGFVTIFDLTNDMFPTKLLSTAYWSYKSPNPESSVRTLYQTILIGDMILMLNTSFDNSINVEEVRNFLTETLKSTTLLPPQKFDVKAKPKTIKAKQKTTKRKS